MKVRSLRPTAQAARKTATSMTGVHAKRGSGDETKDMDAMRLGPMARTGL